MRKYEKTGMIDHLNTHQGDYRNFIEAPDYHTSMNLIREAGEAFMTIPAGIRAKFANDPAQFLAFVQNPDNHDQMVEMGFAKARPLAEKAPPEPEKPSGPPKEPNGDDGGRTAVDPPA
jgi:phage internal scaffolding protein